MVLSAEKLNIIAIIPARGGSKGIPRKNIKMIAGKELIAYSINAGKSSRYIKNLFVSTEDDDIEEVSRRYGADIIKRPSELAEDDSPTIDVILNCLEYFHKNKIKVDVILLLQATSPLRTSQDIDQAIEQFVNGEGDSLISVCELSHSPYWSLKLEDGYLEPNFGRDYLNMRRQDLPLLYAPNGSLFIATPDYLLKNKTFYSEKTLPYLMPAERSIDIDNDLDFKLAELILKEMD